MADGVVLVGMPASGKSGRAHIERSALTVLPRAAIVGEAMVALTLADELLYSFAADSMVHLRAVALRRRRTERRRDR